MAVSRRALREALSSLLYLPPAAIFESVRHAQGLPDTVNANVVTAYLLHALAALPAHRALNRWPGDDRAAGIRHRARRWADLAAVPELSSVSGNPPLILRALVSAHMSFGLALEILFQELFTPQLLPLFAQPGADGWRFNAETVEVGIQAGHWHDFSSLDFNLLDGSRLHAVFRHPDEDGRAPPNFVVRFGLRTKATAVLAAMAAGLDHPERLLVEPLPQPAPLVEAPSRPLMRRRRDVQNPNS